MNMHLSRYAQAYIRGALYAIIAFLTAFCSEFEPLKVLRAEDLAMLTAVYWSLAWAKILLATAVTMRAFFDGTMERITQSTGLTQPPFPMPPISRP